MLWLEHRVPVEMMRNCDKNYILEMSSGSNLRVDKVKVRELILV